MELPSLQLGLHDLRRRRPNHDGLEPRVNQEPWQSGFQLESDLLVPPNGNAHHYPCRSSTLDCAQI